MRFWLCRFLASMRLYLPVRRLAWHLQSLKLCSVCSCTWQALCWDWAAWVQRVGLKIRNVISWAVCSLFGEMTWFLFAARLWTCWHNWWPSAQKSAANAIRQKAWLRLATSHIQMRLVSTAHLGHWQGNWTCLYTSRIFRLVWALFSFHFSVSVNAFKLGLLWQSCQGKSLAT